MNRHIILTILLFFSMGLSFGINPVDDFTSDPQLKSANISIEVKDLKTNKLIYSFRPEAATPTASTMKVVTTSTALELLGPGFRFETLIAYDGAITPEGILNGNLYIIGSGDPTLGSSKTGNRNFLPQWVEAVKKAGIRKINGKIIADESKFANESYNPKWIWEDIGNYYAPGIYAIAYLDNTLQVLFKSGKAGTTPEIINIYPKVPGLQIDNRLTSSTANVDNAYFHGMPKSPLRSVTGEIPQNSPGFLVKAELPDPAGVLVRDFRKKLSDSGIITTDTDNISPYAFTESRTRTLIYTHKSVTLSNIIREINENSNNLYAEQLFKYLSLTRNPVASRKQSIQVIRDFWKSKGLDTDQLLQEDGSGLSPSNGISAGFFVDIMAYMYQKSKYKNDFMGSLSVAGKNGTLSYLLKNTRLEGKVFAKSGSISKVRSYTGYIIDGKHEWAFAIMLNNYNGNAREVIKKTEKLLLQITE